MSRTNTLRSTTQSTTSSQPQVTWYEDNIPTYRLEVEDVLRFLKDIYGDYRDEQFNVRVRLTYLYLNSVDDIRAERSYQEAPGGDVYYIFSVPERKLTEVFCPSGQYFAG